jgi:hypothetical protein
MTYVIPCSCGVCLSARLEGSLRFDHPQFAPNPNTGEPFGQSAVSHPADQTILHDAAHPSSVTLPVITG